LVSVAFLRKSEEDANELSSAARAVVERVAHGMSEEAAAAEVGVEEEEEDLRRWKRESVFRAAIRRARREGPSEVHFYAWNDVDETPPSPFPPPGASDAQVDAEVRQESWRRLR
jgi:hypothetical protein